jgi:hypothetical protein
MIAIVAATVGALFTLSIPRPVPAIETPGLALDSHAVAEALARDRELAGTVPDGPEAEAVRAALSAQSRAEVEGTAEQAVRNRQMDAVRAVRALLDAHGPESLDAIRAEATDRFDEVFMASDDDGPADAGDRNEVVGGFETMLERYGLVRDGERVAPPFVIRTLYKARVNGALYLPMTDGFTPLEAEAYWGWLALEGVGSAPDRRLDALDELDRVTGEEHLEARGTLLYLAGQSMAAADVFERVYGEIGSVRLRNHQLAAVASAAE